MTPERRGKCKYLTLEFEAVEILETLASGKTAQGRLLSTLIRQEEARRAELRRLRLSGHPTVEAALAQEAERAVG
jgi:hypothetical protein